MRTHLDGKERRALGVPKAALRFFASPKSAETMPQLEITWSVNGLEAPSGGFCGLAFGVLGWVSRDVGHGTPKREIFRKSMDERLPWLGVQFYAWFSDSTKSRPNDSQSCRFHGSQLKGSEHRSPSASVWMEIGGREQKTISKCLGSTTVWFQILSCGFGGQGRWSCCVSMSCFVFRIWYLMGNYRGRMVISYLSCCAFLSWLAPRNRSWRTGDVGWLSLSASFSPTAGMWMWQALVNWHAPNNSLPPNAEISFEHVVHSEFLSELN